MRRRMLAFDSGVRAESSGEEHELDCTWRTDFGRWRTTYSSRRKDGLPVILFGGVAFVTPDMYVRADGDEPLRSGAWRFGRRP